MSMTRRLRRRWHVAGSWSCEASPPPSTSRGERLCIVRSPSATVVSSLRRTDQSRFVKFLKKMGRKKDWEEKFQEHYSRVNVHTQLP